MKRTAIYARVSTDTQAKEGDSIPAQLEALREYIRQHDDLVPAGEYVDAGISGTKEQRDELQRMLDDVRAGSIDLIIVTKLDRLHRSLRNFLNMQTVLEKHNCNWLAIWESMYDSQTPQGRMIINTMVNLGQFEAENTGARIRQVFDYKVQQGEVISGKVPHGYAIKDKHLVPGPGADAVRELFEFFSRNGCLTDAVKFYHDRTGIALEPVRIKAILRNTKYIGLFRGNPNYCPPLISPELFQDCQRKLKINVKSSSKYDYIFSGLFVCAECGRRMNGLREKKIYKTKIDRRAAYRCPGHYKRGIQLCPNTKVILERTMEQYLLDNISNLVEEFKIEYSERQKPVRDSRKQIEAIDRKLARLKDLYLNELISLDEYRKDREELLERAKKIRPSEASEPRDFSELNKITRMDLKTVYGTLSNAERRFLWRSVIREIRVGKNREISVVFE